MVVFQGLLLKEPNSFQELITSVLYQTLVTEATVGDSDFTKLMKNVVECTANTPWENTLSSKMYFCWGFLAHFCDRILINSGLNWVKNHSDHIRNLKLDHVYTVICTKFGISDKKDITSELSDKLQQHSCEKLQV